jgi:hypothetical protein
MAAAWTKNIMVTRPGFDPMTTSAQIQYDATEVTGVLLNSYGFTSLKTDIKDMRFVQL